MKIHPSSIISSNVVIEDDVEIGQLRQDVEGEEEEGNEKVIK